MSDGGSALSGAASGAATGSTFGPWGTVIGAGVGAVGGLMGASKASKAQQGAMSQQEREAQADLAFRQGMYNRYLGLYGPIEQQLATEAQSTQPLDYEQNQAQIKEQYANALRNIGTNMGMRGIAGSGLDVGAMRGAALGQAGALSGAYAQGLVNRRNLGLGLTGRNQIMQAGSQVPGGFQGLSNMYGGWAGVYGQAAQQGWQNAGMGLGNLAYGLQSMNRPQPFSITGNPNYGPSFANNWGNPVPTVPTATQAPAGGTYNGLPIY